MNEAHAEPIAHAESSAAIVSLYGRIAKDAPIPLALTAGRTHLLCGANATFCQLLGIKAEALLGLPFVKAVPASTADWVQAILDEVYESGTAVRGVERSLGQAQDPIGYTIWPLLNDQGPPAGLVLLLNDITIRQHDEQVARDSRAVNEQLLIASLHEMELVEQLQHQLVATNAITQELARAHAQLEHTLADAQSLALADALTGLYNRRGFFTLAAQQLKIARRTKQTLSLIFLDLDGLKTINDRYGHPIGDEAITATAHILSAAFRDSDIIARIGGDEFVVLALGSDAYSFDTVMQRVQAQCALHNAQSDSPYQLSLSIGAAHAPPDQPRSLEDLLQQADKEMYAHKQAKQRANSSADRASASG